MVQRLLNAVLAVFIALGAILAPASAKPSVAGGGLIVSLPTVSAQVGGPDIHIPITADNGSVDGVEVTVKYDPTLLSPVDADSGLDGIQVTLGDCNLPWALLNHVNTNRGEVHLALGRGFTPNEPVQLNNCTLGTISFRPVATGVSSLQFVHRTEAAADMGLAPITTQNGQVTITRENTYVVRVDWNTYAAGVMWGIHSKDVSTKANRGTWLRDGSYAGKTLQLDTSAQTERFSVPSEQTPWAFATSVGYLELISVWDATVCPMGPEVFATPSGVTIYAPAGISAGWQLKDASGATLNLNQHQVGRNLQLAVLTADNRLCALAGYEHK